MGMSAALIAAMFAVNVKGLQAQQVVSSREEMRQPWQPAAAGTPFIHHWLICGQFPAVGEDMGVGTDYLADQGGEAKLTPQAGMSHQGPDGVRRQWVAYDSPTDVVDIAAALKSPPADRSISYAFATVNSDKDTKALLGMGSDDGVKLYVNGKCVFTNIVNRGAEADTDVVEIDLKKGQNQLLFKIQNTGADVGVCARVLDPRTLAIRPAAVAVLPSTDANTLRIQLDRSCFHELSDAPAAQIDLLAVGGSVAASQAAHRGDDLSLNVATLKDGPYEIRCVSSTIDGARTVSYTPYFKGDMLAAARKLVAAAATPREGDLTTPMLAELIRDRFAGKFDQATSVPDYAFASVHSALMEYEEMQLAAQGKPEAQVRPGGFVRLAYVDDTDGSTQFCRAYLPPHYDPAKKWPMVVYLHGYNGQNPPYIRAWSVDMRHQDTAENHDVIVIEPHGRGNGFYQGIARLDVLRSIELAKAKFPVDEDRVLLQGLSMGGMGTWGLGTRYPELFAGIAPAAGGMDYHTRIPADEIAAFNPRRRMTEERGSTYLQAESLLTTPVFVTHGDADGTVPIDGARYGVRMLQRWGYNVRYWERPGVGHTDAGSFDEVISWFLAQRRVHPTQVRLRAAELKYAHSHWLSVEQQENPWALIQGEAKITSPNRISLQTENALEVALTPGDLVDSSKPVQVEWNGREVRPVSSDAGRIVLRADGYTPAPLSKSPRREGPISDFTATPFAIVVGTASADPLMRENCRAKAQAEVDYWQQWQHVKPRVFLDTELSEADMARYSLGLIGGPEANLVARKLADRIPLAIRGNTVTIDGKSFEAPDAAVGLICPHPLNEQRYLRITAATSATGMAYHKGSPETMDFYINDGRVSDPQDGVPSEKILVTSGTFDCAWHISDKLTLVGDSAVRAQLPVRKIPAYASVPADVSRLMLSDLQEQSATGGFEGVSRDLNARGKALTLGGKSYASGLSAGLRGPGTAAEFAVGGGWKHLKATIGIEPNRDSKALDAAKQQQLVVWVTIKGDGKELFHSEPFRWDSAPQEINVNVEGVKVLRLEISGNAPRQSLNSVDFAEIRLEK
jgi:predicted peptidase